MIGKNGLRVAIAVDLGTDIEKKKVQNVKLCVRKLDLKIVQVVLNGNVLNSNLVSR